MASGFRSQILVAQKKFTGALELLESSSSANSVGLKAQLLISQGEVKEAISTIVESIESGSTKNASLILFALKSSVEARFEDLKDRLLNVVVKTKFPEQA